MVKYNDMATCQWLTSCHTIVHMRIRGITGLDLGFGGYPRRPSYENARGQFYPYKLCNFREPGGLWHQASIILGLLISVIRLIVFLFLLLGLLFFLTCLTLFLL